MLLHGLRCCSCHWSLLVNTHLWLVSKSLYRNEKLNKNSSFTDKVACFSIRQQKDCFIELSIKLAETTQLKPFFLHFVSFPLWMRSTSFWLQIMQNKVWNRPMRFLWCVKLKQHCRHQRHFYSTSKQEFKSRSAPCRRKSSARGKCKKKCPLRVIGDF